MIYDSDDTQLVMDEGFLVTYIQKITCYLQIADVTVT